jgi:hypothetical protein
MMNIFAIDPFVLDYVDQKSLCSLLKVSKDYNTLLRNILGSQEYTIDLDLVHIYSMRLTISSNNFRRMTNVNILDVCDPKKMTNKEGRICIFMRKFIEFVKTYNITKVHIIQGAYDRFFEVFKDFFYIFPELRRTYILNIEESGIEETNDYYMLIERYISKYYKYICEEYEIDLFHHKYQCDLSLQVYCNIFALEIDMKNIPIEGIIICDSVINGDADGIYNIDMRFNSHLKKITFKRCLLNFHTINANIQIEYIDCDSV